MFANFLIYILAASAFVDKATQSPTSVIDSPTHQENATSKDGTFIPLINQLLKNTANNIDNTTDKTAISIINTEAIKNISKNAEITALNKTDITLTTTGNNIANPVNESVKNANSAPLTHISIADDKNKNTKNATDVPQTNSNNTPKSVGDKSNKTADHPAIESPPLNGKNSPKYQTENKDSKVNGTPQAIVGANATEKAPTAHADSSASGNTSTPSPTIISTPTNGVNNQTVNKESNNNGTSQAAGGSNATEKAPTAHADSPASGNTSSLSPTIISTPTNTSNGNGSTVDSNAVHKNMNKTDTPETVEGVPKWKAILITAAVVIIGCLGVVLVKRSLRSERGRIWLERTRRQANLPYRDYEVQYLVIRDTDD